MKELNHVDVAEYAKAHRIDDRPTFAYRVSYTLRKREMIVAGVTTGLGNTTLKYGIDVPRNLAEARILDEKTKTTIGTRPLKRKWITY